MGISRYNSEGYYDPTAHLAIRTMEQKDKVLRISYPTGYMDIRLDAFFPCTIKKARKIFRLVQSYSSFEDKKRILSCLRGKEQKYKSQIQTFSGKLAASQEKAEMQKWDARLGEAKRLLHRTQRNIELFREAAGYGGEM